MRTEHSVPVPEDGRIVIAGDWHGDTPWIRQALHRIRKAGHRHIIHVGDLGVLWPEDIQYTLTREQRELMPAVEACDPFTWHLVRLLEKYDLSLYFVDGNHDNHPALRALPLDSSGFGVISDRLKYIPRGHRWNIGGVRFAGLGGAYSINRRALTPGLNWWPEEEVIAADIQTLGREDTDVLITHEVPAGIDVVSSFSLPPLMEAQANASRILVGDAARGTRAQVVFSGHWHQRLSARLPGTGTEVQVLDKNGTAHNMVVLNLKTLSVAPLAAMVQLQP